MKSAVKFTLSAFLSAALILCSTLSAAAEVTLPDGTAAGLLEELTVMDSDGNAVSEDGEYFFYVENMQPDTEYTKNIEIMNLREDKAYHIYFYAEPIGWSGDFNLEDGCTAVFTLDGEEVFTGSVSGLSSDGTVNLADEPIDLGLYEPNDSATLSVSITWTGDTADYFKNYGTRLVSSDGVEILEAESGDNYIEGKVWFRWIFYAAVDEEYTPPNTGIFDSGNIGYFAVIAILAILIIFILIAILIKKRRNSRENEDTQGGELNGA